MSLESASVTSLRVFREVVERGTLTAAATALGYTQSAVSRQVAALERDAGTPLLERHRSGVRPTDAGRLVARRAAAVLDELGAGARELAGLPDERATVRLGWFATAGAVVVPRALAALARSAPGITVVSREGTTPTLVRGLRAGTLDLAVLAQLPPYRPPDTESPPLTLQVISEGTLRLGVPAGDPLAHLGSVTIEDLRGRAWIAGPEGALGVWPGLDERPRVAHTARDWLAKLALVAAGQGITTVPSGLVGSLPAGVVALRVRDGSAEDRRVVVARVPGPPTAAVAQVLGALRAREQKVSG
ncbi:LysR family transcriptional regulator [Actinomycetospora sp. TBRC 11914]|uniref:LysR family transcriptional regulator n=1 Tax=Actinomycetospora sp. TBRC 11914 TaxID=2729387 RepID=UPI00145EE2B9|nr:LysR family transcriptional regulator [Actinomycetospora sp. TBRC 11914]NMO89951.1 LysR family transcriptional regulator [Actinomycetospora sp. TBRC 11914]